MISLRGSSCSRSPTARLTSWTKAPVALAQYPELAQQFVRTASLQKHVHMVAIDRSGVNDHLVRPCRLSQQLPAPLPDIAAKHRMAILRHPNQVILAVSNSLAAPLVCFHPANLHRIHREPSRLKAWGFPIPYRGL
ncbi:hypothetical protein MPL3356_270021 [Mesorhizobium plurifarium]|uniref:Uncharacterized protein n=1 Tax=Mesorhizobium plurifarium TaxID=69974 RepID=A0A090DP64_MESPL|nr:hypothetical protein MPL3356_270021 [Mesorhizobium plurifarium]